MKKTVIVGAIGLAALLLGLFLALPLFSTNLNHPALKYPGGVAYISLDVLYAYFKLDSFNQYIPGLWRNTSDSSQIKESLVNYLIVLNITSYSNHVVYMERFETSAAKYMSSVNNKSCISFEASEMFFSSARLTDGENDRLHQVYPTATRWEPYESRLVALWD